MRLNRSTAVILLALLAIAASIQTAYAQSPSAAATAGLTTVQWSLNDNTYTWTLKNNSGQAGGGILGYNVLVWSLEPSGVPEPIDWTAPAGWMWRATGGHQAFEISNPNEKYNSPPALPPGESAVFTYTFEPGSLANSGGLTFMTHVAAVENAPTPSGTILRWIPMTVQGLGGSWYDASVAEHAAAPQVSELPGALAFIVGAVWMATSITRSRRRVSGIGARFVIQTKL